MTIEVSSPLSERIPFIGRDNIVDKIITAIKEAAPSRWMFYVTGAAGIGKTRLQEEIGWRVEALPDYDCKWAGIIDFYHTEFHSPGGVRQAIIDALAPNNQHFQTYRQVRKEFEEKRARGFTGQAIEDLRQKLDETFRDDYIALAKESGRVVLTFDTVEFMQYESDSVQEICRVEEEGTIVKNWLLEQVSQLPNTVVVLAGRPRPKMEAQFVSRYKNLGWQVETPALDQFSFEETQKYLAEIGRQAPLLLGIVDDLKNQHQLFNISGGRPIYLAIILDLIRTDTGLTFGEIFEKLTPEEVGIKLVDLYTHLDRPWYDIMYWLVRARKGVDAKLLQYLTGWNEAEVQANMALARSLAIVKFREKTGQLFLHDEVYDRVDQFFQNDTGFVQSIEPLAEYYRQLGAPMDLESDILVARLYYELRLNPRRGYNEFYARWDDEAIVRHNIGLDMRMRDEVLHFLNRYTKGELEDKAVSDRIDRDDIDRDCAVRWLSRYFHRSQYKKGDEVANDLRHSTDPLFNWDIIEDPLYKARLSEVWGITKVFRGKPGEEIRPVLNDAIKILSASHAWKGYEGWWIPLILGRAYVDAGYWHRQNRRYREALKFYDQAVKHLSQTEEILDRVMALTNRAYVQAILGFHSAAKNQIAEAIELHRSRFKEDDKPDYDNWSTLSLNSRGAIHLLAGDSYGATIYNEQARHQFEVLGEKRGEALANLNLGQAYRQLGNVWEYDSTKIDECLQHYVKSLECLNQTLSSKKDVMPMGDLLDAYLEQSRVKRSQGQVMLFRKEYLQGEKFLKEALDIIAYVIKQAGDEWPVQKIDGIEDKVDILVLQRKFDEAEQAILEAEAIVRNQDPRYLLDKKNVFEAIEQPSEDFWKILGRMELHRAHIIILKASDILPSLPDGVLTKTNHSQTVSNKEQVSALLNAMTHYARSFTYFFAFSPELESHEKTLSEIFRLLKDQDPAIRQSVRQRVIEIDNEYPDIKLAPLLRHIDQALAAYAKDDDLLLL